MVYFRDQQWLMVQGGTRFDALIKTDHQKPDDVFWMLDLRFVAGGAKWRRVKHWLRPSLWLEVSSFKPKLRHWTDLEQLNFWNLEAEEDPQDWIGPGGALDSEFYPNGGSAAREEVSLNDVVWRVAARDGGWFTVELAATADGKNLLDLWNAREVKVTPEGREERTEPDAEFWQKHASLYLLEDVPFGTITVRVPRNVRDPEAYALGRARALAGTDAPEHIDVTDHLKSSQHGQRACPENIAQDIFVELHFNGFYED